MTRRTIGWVGLGALASASAILVPEVLLATKSKDGPAPRDHEVEPEGSGAVPVTAPADDVDLSDRTLENRHAYIPPQCYVDTRDAQDGVHNSCYTCHTDAPAPNFIRDADLQQMYDFPAPARTNRWSNLFVDRREAVASISDEEILAYVQQNNYADANEQPRLVARLADVPETWDVNGNGVWDGFVPDAGFSFDNEGFDHDAHGAYTGWRAYQYYPLPGAFLPTNGSMGDALIRLPSAFRTDAAGNVDLEIYRVNLAIVEAVVGARDVRIDPVDETKLGVDLDKDGQHAMASWVKFDWAPRQGRTMSYVGRARAEQDAGRVHLARGLFPEGTEFLHSVRYLDVVDDEVALAPRMKELRYMQKTGWLTYSQLEAAAAAEIKEGDDFPDRLRTIHGDAERGLFNGQGWRLVGFIEDRRGELRPQTFEETAFCIGCHSGVGVTTDTVFSWTRKLGEGAQADGWTHPSQHGLRGVPEPRRADGSYEYTTYLERVRGGDDARSNAEVSSRFFDDAGALRSVAVETLHGDIGTLLLPSAARALELDKAYRTIVEEQSFIRGRDATVVPPASMLREVDEGRMTGVADAS